VLRRRRRDSNSRPPRSKRGALDPLSYDGISVRSVPAAPPTRGECGTARAPEGSDVRPSCECGAPAARRDSGCAEQWESRSPLLIAPCHAGRRCSTVLHVVLLLRVSSQTIGLSISGSSRVAALGANALVLRVHSCSAAGETRTPHLAPGAGGACRTAPIRWWGRCAMAPRLGTRTLHHFFLRRAVDTRTRSSCPTSLRSIAACDCPAGSFASRSCRARRRPNIAHASPSRRLARTSSRRAGVRRRAVGVWDGDA
jgi:hypothetical protein